MNQQQWEIQDFANAMLNAVQKEADSRYLRQSGEKLLFNGFWREGDKQNVCVWLDKATWHDAKTGEGGGCKEFAQVAFNMSLPEFMNRFSSSINIKSIEKQIFSNIKISKSINEIFLKLKNQELSIKWLEEKRGMKDPKNKIGSGFFDLTKNEISLFDPKHQHFLKLRLKTSKQMIVPLRSVFSEQVKNLYFRSIEDCSKEEKSRLLPDMGGWQEEDGTPRAFGYPHLILESPNLILCEGMADYFAAECLLEEEEKYLPIGAASASALFKWALWLIENKYRGKVIIIFHLDKDKYGHLSDKGIGQENAIKCIQVLNQASIKAEIFPWLSYLDAIEDFTQKMVIGSIKDLADSLIIDSPIEDLKNIFKNIISGNKQ